MKIITDTEEEMVIKNNPSRTGKLILAAGFLLAFLAVLTFILSVENRIFVFGGGGGALFLLVVYLSFYELSEYRFNFRSGRIKWTRVQSFQRNEGEIPISDIKDVGIQRPKVDYTYNMSRIVLVSADSREIPLTDSYIPHTKDTIDVLNRIRERLNLPN